MPAHQEILTLPGHTRRAESEKGREQAGWLKNKLALSSKPNMSLIVSLPAAAALIAPQGTLLT